MLELLKSVVDLFGKILNPEIFKMLRSDERKRRKLGVELYLVYIDLNRVVTEGHKFIEFLSDYLKSRANDKNAGFPSRPIQGFIRRQGVLLKEIYDPITSRMNGVLTIIDPQAVGRIQVTAEQKREMMDRHYREITERQQLQRNLDLGRLILDIKTDEYLVLPQFRDGEPIPDSIADKIQLYLEKARSNLEDLQDCTEQLGKSLEKYFTISDLLVPISQATGSAS